MKDLTPLGHVAAGVAMFFLFYLIIGEVWFGSGFAIGWFWSREHTQREASIFPRGEYKPSEWWRGFLGWSQDRWLDAILPTVVVLLFMFWMG